MEKNLKFKKRIITGVQKKKLKNFIKSALDVFVFIVSYLVFDSICSSEFNFITNKSFINFFISFVPIVFNAISLARLVFRIV